MSDLRAVSCGVHQGSNLDPFLFPIIYVNDLPNCLNAASPRTFADDTRSFAAPTLSDLENVLNWELGNVNLWLKVNKVSLNIAKTECMVIESRQRLNVNTDGNINIEINDQSFKK